MAQQTKKSSSFVKQAGILAAAGIISRIVGMLYKGPATAIIGDEGMGYYSPAYNIYVIILLISSYSIPSAISKVISHRLALREYKNAHRIFICAIYYVIVVGLAGSLFAFFAADLLVGSSPAMVLRVLAPTIFFSGLLGVFRGYFQARGTMMQTAVSQILEQIMHVIVSLVAAGLMVKTAIGMTETQTAERGAMGSALGVDIGVLIALLFMAGIYLLNKGMIHRQINRDRTPESSLLSYQEIFRIIFLMVTPIILSTFIYNLSTSLNQTIFLEVMQQVKGAEEKEVHMIYGLFANKAVTLSNIPIAVASAMSSAALPSIAGSYATNDKKEVRRKIDKAIRTTMFISIPCAVGLIVLAKPIVFLLFPQTATVDLSAHLLQAIGVTVIFYALSTLTNAVLQAIGRVNKPVTNALIALVIQTAVLVGLLLFTPAGIYSLAAAMVVYSFLMCLFNNFSVKKAVGYKQEWTKTFLLPIWAAVLMGLAAAGIYYGLDFVLPAFALEEKMAMMLRNLICLIPAIGLGGLTYFAATLKFGVMEKKELLSIPGGSVIVKIAVKMRLLPK